MPIGEPQLLKFALLPVAWRFAKGSRIRLSIGGADADHFVQTPHGRPPTADSDERRRAGEYAGAADRFGLNA